MTLIYFIDATQCDQPENVTNADYTVTTLDSGGTVTYTCTLPYTHGTGNLVRTCDNNGEWTGSLPACMCGASPGTVFTGDDVVKLASDPIVMGNVF